MRLLALLLLLPSLAWATDYYVSNSTGNSYSVGDDANGCTDKTSDVCLTPTRGLAVATTGDTITVNCGTYTGSGLGGSNQVSITKNATLQPETAECVTFTATSTTIPITTSSSLTGPATIGAFVVDAGSAASAIQIINNSSADVDLTISGAVLTCGTTDCISDTARRGDIVLTDVSMTGTTQYGYSQSTNSGITNDKSATITDVSCAITAAADALNACINSVRYSAGAPGGSNTLTIDGLTGSIAGTVAATGSSVDIYGVRGSGVAANISNMTFTASNDNTAKGGYGIYIEAPNSNAPAHNAAVDNVDITLEAPEGYGVLINPTATSGKDNYANYPVITNSTVTCPTYYASNTPHGIAVGAVTGGVVHSNLVKTCYVGIITGTNQGALITGNVMIGNYGESIFIKGSGNTTAPTFANNTIIIRDVIGAQRSRCIGVAVQGAVANAAANVYNNSCYADGDLNKFTGVDTGQTATFSNNNYYSTVAIPSNAFAYQGTTYANLAAWVAAQESTATGVDPQMISATSSMPRDFRLKAGSTLRRAGKELNIGNYQDHEDRAFMHPPSIGAWEAASGDAATARTAR